MPIIFLHPKYLPTWLGLWLLWLVAKTPQWIQHKIGEALGILLHAFWSSRRRIVTTNLTWCFPNQNKHQRETLIKKHFRALGLALIELANCFYLSDKALAKRYQLTGLEILTTAQQQKPVILLLGHFTTMLITGRMLNQRIPIADVYFRHKNKLFEWKMKTLFEQYGAYMVDNQNMRQMIAALKKGLPLWYAPDQDYGEKISVFAPFFNIDTATTTATARLARITDAYVLPFSYYQSNGTYYLRIHPPLENYPKADEQNNASVTNAILEAQIKQMPEQYLWTHRRFKTRPNNEKSPY